MGSLKNGVGRGQLEDKEEEGGEEEPILMEKSQRFCMFPIRYPQLWEMYKKSQASFWTVRVEINPKYKWDNSMTEEADLSQDVQQWDSLSNSEKHFVSHVLAFFATSDGIVLENLAARFLNDVQIPEMDRKVQPLRLLMFEISLVFPTSVVDLLHSWSGFGILIRSRKMYSLLLETYIRDSREKHRLFNAIENIPCVAQKAKWALDWIQSSPTHLQKDLLPLHALKEYFSQGASAPFFGLKRGDSCQVALLLLLQKQLQWQKVHHIVHKAVEIETQFVCEALPCALIGMNSTLMSQYIKFVADRLLAALQCHTKYNVENPFDWMEFISLQGKANFFERRVGDYQKASVMSGLQDGAKNFAFTLDEDFYESETCLTNDPTLTEHVYLAARLR
ncbi:unnamed protein product [Camellia sinensis]